MPQKSRIVFYGVDEYAGALFSRRAHAAGLAHVAAGRDIARVAAHANALGAGGLVEPRVFGLAHAGRIAAQLDIAEHDVRAFCPKPKEKILRRHLPRRAVEALLHGRHASIGGRTVAKRSRYLVEIASAYTWNELMSESGVGTVTASEIRLWLEERGAALRGDEDDQHRSAQW